MLSSYIATQRTDSEEEMGCDRFISHAICAYEQGHMADLFDRLKALFVSSRTSYSLSLSHSRRGDGSPPRSSPGSSIGVLGHFDSGDLAMTPAAPGRVLGSVTPTSYSIAAEDELFREKGQTTRYKLLN